MVATAAAANHKSRNRRPWAPEHKDHLIYQWVRFDGISQAWTANEFGLSQATVSRIVQRYERWQAHAKEREGGRLDHTERLRAQQWLTFERNELILAHCLRLAGTLEGFVDTSKSTTVRPQSKFDQERTVRTESSVLDRTGIASRFLRLAYRINMEQLKLAQLDEPPPAEPLTAEEIAAEERADAAVAAELAEAELRSEERSAQWRREHAERLKHQQEYQRLQQIEEAERQELAKELEQQAKLAEAAESEPTQNESVGWDQRAQLAPAHQSQTANGGPALAEAILSHPTHSPASVHNLHNLHNAGVPQNGATADESCSCEQPPRTGKKSKPTCITDQDPANWRDESQSNGSATGSKRRRTTAAAK
jgi:transposase